MANSINTNQNTASEAVWSGSALFVLSNLSETLVYEILGHLAYIFSLPAYGS